jgi:hypothetical protein
MENRINTPDMLSMDNELQSNNNTDVPKTSDLNSNTDIREFYFGNFRIRGAHHKETSLTIHRDGKWFASSRVQTSNAPFKPLITLSLEFFRSSTGMQVPVGSTEHDWSPKHLWSACFGKTEEKTINKKGESDFIRHHFDTLLTDAEGKLRMRLQRKGSWFSRMF